MINYEDALLERRVFEIDGGRVVVHEEWDLNHPSCPMIPRERFMNPLQSPGMRQIIMTRHEYDTLSMPLKPKPR